MKITADKLIIPGLILFVTLFLALSGTPASGYHFIDDHEIIRINHDLEQQSFSTVAHSWIKEDINSTARFRPFYFFMRVLETRLFGTNFLLWFLFNGMMWCLSMIFFFLGMRKLTFNLAESLIFLLIAFIGPQAEVWWRLGPQESLGITLIGLSFYFMALAISGRRKLLNSILFVIFLILASLSKESFILCIPAFLILKIWMEKIGCKDSLKELLVDNLILLIPVVFGIAELIYIKMHVSTVNSGIGLGISEVFRNTAITSFHFARTYLNLLIAGALLYGIKLYIKSDWHWFRPEAFIFFLFILIPNILLYSQSGLNDRYLIPSSVGLAFFTVSCIKGITDRPDWFRKMAYLVILLAFLPFLAGAFRDAKSFTSEGKATNKLLSAVSETYKAGDNVLLVADPVESYEQSVSMKTYLSLEDNIEIYGYCLTSEAEDTDKQSYIEGWKSYFEGRLYENMNSAPSVIILFDSRLSETFFRESRLISEKYSVEKISNSFSVFRVR